MNPYPDRADVILSDHGGVVRFWSRYDSMRILRRLIQNIQYLNRSAIAAELLSLESGALDREINRELQNLVGPSYSDDHLVKQVKEEIIQLLQPAQSRPTRSIIGDLSEETILGHLKTRRCCASAAAAGGVNKDDEDCSICVHRLHQDYRTIATLDCRHEYHLDCIEQWLLRGKSSCSLCRDKALQVDSIYFWGDDDDLR